MKMLPQVLFWLGLISIPFAWLVWYVGPQMEMVRPVLASISDPALRAALQEAHATAASGSSDTTMANGAG